MLYHTQGLIDKSQRVRLKKSGSTINRVRYVAKSSKYRLLKESPPGLKCIYQVYLCTQKSLATLDHTRTYYRRRARARAHEGRTDDSGMLLYEKNGFVFSLNEIYSQ